MAENLKIIQPEEINDNAFKLIGTDWTLITAGEGNDFNTMTASWGGVGVLWGKKVCFIYVRPQRHTRKFTDEGDKFTLTFFDEKYRDVLKYCGSKSGKDVDKVAATGLTTKNTESGAVYFDEARLVIECKKIYYQDVDPNNFVDADIDKNYPNKDYHRMYVGEILNCYIKE